MKDHPAHATWLEIDLQAIRGHVALFRRRTGAEVMAVVKANAYGHGMVPVAQAALQAGAAWLGVARPEEASELRAAGLPAPVQVLGYTPQAQLDQMLQQQVSLTVWGPEQVAQAGAAAARTGHTARLHLKVDTGMSRLGIEASAAVDLARNLSQAPGVVLEGVFTHFARADEQEPGPTDEQARLFAQVLEGLSAIGLKPAWRHAANSAAGLTRPAAGCNLVRAGIALYGLAPSPQVPLPAGMRPALCWKAVLSQVKSLPPGRGVSYGHIYTTQKHERLGTVPVGYADGFRRVTGNQALVGGRRVPVVGRVCMDQIMVQLDAVPDAQPGDEVVLIGAQGEQTISADEIARHWGTINYEVTSGIAARVPRFYT